MSKTSVSKKRKSGKSSTNIKQSKSRQNNNWTKLSDKELLDVRVCDLKLDFQQSILGECIERLYVELKDRGIRVRPHCWLSDDWFSPDNVPGIAVPFYMAHPRLMRLERKQMLEVEGGTKSWCMRILRHETGHALDTAYRLHRRKKYRDTFGNYNAPYPDYYRPKPGSKSFVLHLEPWYAQSHPSEDFAETFAVWLNPRSGWRKKYANWKALKKIEFVDSMMQDIAGKPAKIKSRAKVDPVHRIKKTLRDHYAERHARYGIECPKTIDHDLEKLFSQIARSHTSKTAASFLQKNRSDLSRMVAQWTGEYRYNINQVLREMITRCQELDLYATSDQQQLKQNAAVMLTVHTMNYLHGGHYRVAL